MRKLLSANLRALVRSRIFQIQLIAVAIFSGYVIFANYSPEIQASAFPLYLDDVFFNVYQLMGIVLAASVTLIVGSEHSDGTIRNKLVVGHTRLAIYFSMLLTQLLAVLPVLAGHGVVSYVLGRALLEPCQLSPERFLLALLFCVLNTLAFSALFVAISLNCSNKAVASVAAMLLVLALTLVANTLGTRLLEPEMTYDGITITADGAKFGEMVKNPAYVPPEQRPVYEFFYDLLPIGQIIQIQQGDFARMARWPVFTALFFLISTAGGYLLFRKKDIN